MLEKIRKPYIYSILGFSLINSILCLCTYGYKDWYHVYYNGYLLDYTIEGTYYAKIIDVSTIGSIFFVLCCLVMVSGGAILFLKFIKKIEKKQINIAFTIMSLITGVLGIFAQSIGKSEILKYISLTKWPYGGRINYVQAFFGDKYILSLILSLSILMIIYSAIELVNYFTPKKTNINDNIYTVEL